jgi:hypothetical protein
VRNIVRKHRRTARAPSLANHMGGNIDDAITFMSHRDASFCAGSKRLDNQLRQKLPGWRNAAQLPARVWPKPTVCSQGGGPVRGGLTSRMSRCSAMFPGLSETQSKAVNDPISDMGQLPRRVIAGAAAMPPRTDTRRLTGACDNGYERNFPRHFAKSRRSGA